MRRPQFDRAAGYAPLVTASAISIVGAWMFGEGIAVQAAWPPAIVAAAVLAAIAAYAAIVVARAGRARLPDRLPA
jgi:hypothetical protein